MNTPFTVKYWKLVESVKHLGVTINRIYDGINISRTLELKETRLGFLRRNLRIHSPDLKSIAYKGLVRPNVEYASTVWDPYTKQNKDRVEMVQRRAARYVLNCYERTASVTEMLKQLD